MLPSTKPKIIIIAGPTASGKTGLAVDLALSLGGEIINADSMQAYRYMDIGTAKPTVEERRGIIHHLLDIVDPDETFNAATFRQMALPLAKRICANNIPCFIVGGTGLYIKVLLGGLVELPPSDPLIREQLTAECDDKGAPQLHRRLTKLDPERAKSIHPNDRLRIVRALEIIQQTHRASSDLLKRHQFKNQDFLTLKLNLRLEKEVLYDRINQRAENMIRGGIIEETKSLLKRGYGPELKPMSAIGYRHVQNYLKRKWTLDEATTFLKRDTRRYAKRQMTWFKADPDMIPLNPKDRVLAEEKIRVFLKEST